ncbi:glycosyltransferase family 61 protein [Haloterrigena alkaliphila]|uniref:Glycosyltransferase family 61 protein n=1 Tax=Haloterrigena alkaliphila TaxID=2816475 RepID=A0A8A2VH34_9EURY|nr:glycosyltransferase family 61 protein [Haloterrigena alkaliphila]QSW99642.1 glycosyltransferase family 61 protein [Haloterrigena alkaliphila]
MEINNLPGRTIRKLRSEGASELLEEGKNTLLIDFLYYRFIYEYILRERLEILSREEIRQKSDLKKQYEGLIRLKGNRGFRGQPEPEYYEAGDRFVCEVSNAKVLGPAGPGVTPDGKIIADTVGTPPLTHRRVGISLSQSMSTNGVKRTIDLLSGSGETSQKFDQAAIALPPWKNYYHWMVECLIRIRLLEEYGSDTGIYPTLLVPGNLSSWMTESLEIIDYQGEIRKWDGGTASIDTLVVPTFPDPTPTECVWLRNRMRTDDLNKTGTERIFIARDDATVRRVTNIDAVQGVLNRYDIETHVLGQLSVHEQIDLFSRAELVVATHGAGLTNIIFGYDLSVVEIFGDKKMATFDRIAENMSHKYSYLDCQQRGPDIKVDTRRLETAIRRALED